jgi:hypothetical protein
MNFVTLAEAKAYLGITTSTEDTSLGVTIAAVNAFIPTYCNRIFDETTYDRELYNGSGQASLVLKNRPVIEITEVLVRGEEIELRSDDQTEDQTGYYYFDLADGIIYNNNIWERGRGIIQISYTAGYVKALSDQYDTSIALPLDLQWAACEMVAYFRNVQGKAGILSESLGSYSYRLATGINDMSGELTIPNVMIKNVLDRYKDIYLEMSY